MKIGMWEGIRGGNSVMRGMWEGIRGGNCEKRDAGGNKGREL